MNRVYSKENKKDRFITDHLLPYLLKYIEDSEEPDTVTESVACMYIFPYKTSDGIRIGSLKESGVSWYFAAENDKDRISSGSYRVFADDTMKKEQIRKFRQIFHSGGLITEFSDAAVVMDLILRMSKETDYTELWWTCAYDVYRLWNPEKDNIIVSDATRSMMNNYFLFDEKYEGRVLKDELIRFGVFRDILTDSARRLFWNKIPRNEKAKAKETLKRLGVPCSFVDTIEKRNGTYSQWIKRVNPYILRFARIVGEEVSFPVAYYEDENARCSLSHWLFMDIIYKESKEAFESSIYDDDEGYNEGVVLKNINGEYVPLSWHLFYSKEDLEDEKADYEEYSEEGGIESDESRYSKLEYLHVDTSLYDQDFITGSEKIHEFSEVCETADEYDIDEDDTEDFYKWVWSYSKHAELAHNILSYYSGDAENRRTLEEDANDFVLSVIENNDAEDAGYAFDIDLQAHEAFRHSEVINKISKCYEKIYAVVYSNYSRIDVRDYVRRILDATKADYTEKSIIERADIWKHVYLVDGERNLYESTFLLCEKYDESYEDALLLWPSDEDDSYVRALAGYIRSCFNVKVDIADAEAFNWREQYLNLAKGIKSFITYKSDKRDLRDMYGNVADMEDVDNFGDEKHIWSRLKNQREIIMAQEVGRMPVNLSSWRTYLDAKYKGRCQLCGGRTITGEQYAHFKTFRIIKESENGLANMNSNMFCLCPSCWGEMQYGGFMGQDLSDLFAKAERYANYLEDKIRTGDMEDDFPSLVSEVWEDQVLTEDEEKLEGFHNPIVCHVMVNGKDRSMAFSWEHFMKIAFILSETEEVEE